MEFETPGIWGSSGVIMYYKVGGINFNPGIPAFNLSFGIYAIALAGVVAWLIKYKRIFSRAKTIFLF